MSSIILLQLLLVIIIIRPLCAQVIWVTCRMQIVLLIEIISTYLFFHPFIFKRQWFESLPVSKMKFTHHTVRRLRLKITVIWNGCHFLVISFNQMIRSVLLWETFVFTSNWLLKFLTDLSRVVVEDRVTITSIHSLIMLDIDPLRYVTFISIFFFFIFHFNNLLRVMIICCFSLCKLSLSSLYIFTSILCEFLRKIGLVWVDCLRQYRLRRRFTPRKYLGLIFLLITDFNVFAETTELRLISPTNILILFISNLPPLGWFARQ